MESTSGGDEEENEGYLEGSWRERVGVSMVAIFCVSLSKQVKKSGAGWIRLTSGLNAVVPHSCFYLPGRLYQIRAVIRVEFRVGRNSMARLTKRA